MPGPVRWLEHAASPVFDLGPPGAWDAGSIFDASVVESGDTLRMWYTGNAVSPVVNVDLAIGYAWSLDGIDWNRHPGPVLTGRPGQWDSAGVASPNVILDGNTLRMWYTTTFQAGPGRAVGYATSTDGITWMRRDEPVLEVGPTGDWDDSFLAPGAVVEENGGYVMWYSGATGVFPDPATIQVGHATSPDGITWTKYDDSATTAAPRAASDPVLEVGAAGAFDEVRAWTAAVFAFDRVPGYEMWYTGEGFDGDVLVQAIGYATSPDGIRWEKHIASPVLRSDGGWAHEFIAPTIVRDGDEHGMWFTGFSHVPVPVTGRIGYATGSR